MNKQNESASASTLRLKSTPHDKLEIVAMNYFMKMNADQKQRHLDQAQQMLGSAWSKSGGGIKDPENIASKNRCFNKEDFDLMQFDNNLYDTLESMGFNEEARQKARELFYEAVEQRLFHEDSAFRAKVIDILNVYAPSPFISNEQLEILEMLANRINLLESHIEAVESESEQLAEEINRNLQEEYDYDLHQKDNKPTKRSSIEEMMLTPDEDNFDALFNEEQENKYLDGNMRAYLNALDRTQR